MAGYQSPLHCRQDESGNICNEKLESMSDRKMKKLHLYIKMKNASYKATLNCSSHISTVREECVIQVPAN